MDPILQPLIGRSPATVTGTNLMSKACRTGYLVVSTKKCAKKLYFPSAGCGPVMDRKLLSYIQVIDSIKPWRTAGKPFGEEHFALLCLRIWVKSCLQLTLVLVSQARNGSKRLWGSIFKSDTSQV